MLQQSEPNPNAQNVKLVVVGDGSVGKTWLDLFFLSPTKRY